MDKKKLTTAVAATATAAALLLGGTFAWQSISQTALNEKEEIINPGGRLHNDQNWISDKKNDTNIYVENFTDPNNGGNDIYARVRLEEYMEIVMNKGKTTESVQVVTGSKSPKEGSSYTADNATTQNEFDYSYTIHRFGADNATDDWWTWTEGNEDSEDTYYIPTFNKNKDSLLADLNGVFDATVGGFSSSIGTAKYDYEEVTSDSSATKYAVYDGDSNTVDEVGRADLEDLIKTGVNTTFAKNVTVKEEKHDAAKINASNGLISMEKWLELGEDDYADYWVYDEDGWVYWSAPIEAGTTTGLLLDSIELNNVMDDTYYYAINVVAQFITADDLGKDDNTGFYDTDAGTVPTENALKLLEKIGVTVGETADGSVDGSDDETNFPVPEGDTIYRMYTKREDGNYDMTIFSAAEEVTDEDVAAAAESLSLGEVENYGVIGYGDAIKNTVSVKFANQVKPTDMSGWFREIGYGYAYSNIECTFDFTNLDTSAVTDMSSTFSNCKAAKELDLSTWDTSKVTDFGSMFYCCENLEKLDVSSFDTSSAENMRFMFYLCEKVPELDVKSFDTSNVTTMEAMFGWCELVTSLDISGWDTSNVTNMQEMFWGDSALVLDCSKWNVSSVTNYDSFNASASGVTPPSWVN